MAKAKVTFLVEADDPDHEMGVTSETFDAIVDAAMQVGGDEVEVERIDDDG